jgi:DNA-directed RNA polymerase specialized sigma24 family protein
MREYESYSFEEIAKTVGMTPGNVRVQLSRARKLVREIYRNKTKEL